MNLGLRGDFINWTPKAREVKVKLNKWESVCPAWETVPQTKRRRQNGRRYLQKTALTRGNYPKHVKSSCNSTAKKQTIQLNTAEGPKDASPKRTNKRPTGGEKMLSYTGLREKQTRTTVGPHPAPAGVAVIHTAGRVASAGGAVERKGPRWMLLLLGTWPGAATAAGNGTEAPQEFRRELLWDPATPLENAQVNHLSTSIRQEICSPPFAAALSTVAKTWKQAQCLSTERWIKKTWHVHREECHSATRKEELLFDRF